MVWFAAIAALQSAYVNAHERERTPRELMNAMDRVYDRDLVEYLRQSQPKPELPEVVHGLKHLTRGMSVKQLVEFRRLLTTHGPDATYLVLPKGPPDKRRKVRARTFATMTTEEARRVVDQMLDKARREAEARSLKAEQEAIADATYRNKDAPEYDPLRVAKERLDKESR